MNVSSWVLINSTVNFGIVAKSPPASQRDLQWEIFPYDGNCGDYAVTKHHLLLRAGWPSSALLLAEVVIRSTAEHHLVLLVREARAT
ncbi:transglutaminase-like cysteine peptidase [Bradyrhizobium sp. WSM2793]|uniref:transglutaminase-like cysteine peptidase n=1 Tax=Bradyrhizobium sp. WSM2793 TaxID=1038866 RepID=UPI003529388A